MKALRVEGKSAHFDTEAYGPAAVPVASDMLQ